MVSRIINSLLQKRQSLLILICLVIFGMLIFKDVFSTRTLIPNLEPFPDTLHYITGAESLIGGHGLTLTREGRSISVNVPPLYSLALIPALLINKDPRMFYFVNVVLALFTFLFLLLILKRLTKNIWIIGLALFFYVTNFYVYWLPTIAMAENVTQLLFLMGVLLLISKITFKNAFFSGIIAIALYATKYASLPLSGSMILLYVIKIIKEQKSNRIKYLGSFLMSFIISGGIFEVSEYIGKGSTILQTWYMLLQGFFTNFGNSSSNNSSSASGYFSLKYVSVNLPVYLKALIGDPIRFLWNDFPLVDKITGFLGTCGLLISLYLKRFSFLSISLLVMLGTTIIFLSSFYTIDGRYISHAIPTLSIGFVIFLVVVSEKLKVKRSREIVYLLLILLAVLYLKTHIYTLKNQIALNFRHAETPWYYVSVLGLNNYFSSSSGIRRPVVISALPPYFIDYYSNGNYTLLPLSREQEFPHEWVAVWGPNDYSDLSKLYTKYLNEGYSLYVDNYGLGNVGVLHRDFSVIQKNFKTTIMKEGCYEECNIYKVELIKDASSKK